MHIYIFTELCLSIGSQNYWVNSYFKMLTVSNVGYYCKKKECSNIWNSFSHLCFDFRKLYLKMKNWIRKQVIRMVKRKAKKRGKAKKKVRAIFHLSCEKKNYQWNQTKWFFKERQIIPWSIPDSHKQTKNNIRASQKEKRSNYGL